MSTTYWKIQTKTSNLAIWELNTLLRLMTLLYFDFLNCIDRKHGRSLSLQRLRFLLSFYGRVVLFQESSLAASIFRYNPVHLRPNSILADGE